MAARRYHSRRKPYARGVRAWRWGFGRERAHYYALYPRAWNTFELPELGLRLTCRQVSPVIPHNYSVRSPRHTSTVVIINQSAIITQVL